MEKMIMEMLEAGKNDTEIAKAILDSKESKGFTADQIALEISRVKGLADVQASMKKIADEKAKDEAEKKALADMESKVQDAVEKNLKKIGIEDMASQFNTGKFRKTALKRFDLKSGKMMDEIMPDDQYADANHMVACIMAGDAVSAKAISNQIDKENAKIASQRSGSKITPIVSDVSAQGGYAIPTAVNAEIIQGVYEQSICLQRANKNNIIVNSEIYPVMYGTAVNDIADQSTASTESVQTFTNPTVSMKPIGAFSAISNKIIRQKGADLLNAVSIAYMSALAEYLDLRLACGNVTTNTDAFDGFVFDPNTVVDTDVAKGSVVLSTLEDMLSAISYKASQKSLGWMCNRSVKQLIGAIETSAGDLVFPDYARGAQISPLGVPLDVNPLIPNTLDIGADKRTTGTDSVLALIDWSKFIVGIDDNFRISTSDQFYFTTDLTAVKLISAVGCKVLLSNTSASGGVCRVRGITGF